MTTSHLYPLRASCISQVWKQQQRPFICGGKTTTTTCKLKGNPYADAQRARFLGFWKCQEATPWLQCSRTGRKTRGAPRAPTSKPTYVCSDEKSLPLRDSRRLLVLLSPCCCPQSTLGHQSGSPCAPGLRKAHHRHPGYSAPSTSPRCCKSGGWNPALWTFSLLQRNVDAFAYWF